MNEDDEKQGEVENNGIRMGQGPICSTHILFSLGKVDVAKYYKRGIFFRV